LLKQLTKNVLETAPEAKLTEFLGYDKGASRGVRSRRPIRCAAAGAWSSGRSSFPGIYPWH
jgi:hypothetical protein